jgi:teichuronic acid biosynthesis glycosyltransferase TuaH
MSAAVETRTPGATAGPRAWDGMVLLCSGTNWDLGMHDRKLAEALAAHAPVLFVNPPASHLTRLNDPATAELLRGPRLRRAAPRIATYTPLVPPKPMAPAVLPLTRRIVRRQLRQAVAELGGSVDTVLTEWLFLDVYGACGERVDAYWWTDDPAGAAALWGRDPERLTAADERLIARSDLVLPVSGEKAAELRARGVDAHHLPNGCDTPFYRAVDTAPEPDDVDLPGPIVGFVGHLNDRTDLALLEAIAETGTSLLVIGPREESFEPTRFAALAARPNVAYLGRRPFAGLPSYLRKIDVGVVPYADTRFNRSSFPLKMLEYLAAGLPVVSTPLPAVRWLDTDLIVTAADPAEFAAAALAEVAGADDPALVARRRAFAERHSWAARAASAVELLGIPSRPAGEAS